MIHPTKFSHKKGRFMYSYSLSKNRPITMTCVNNAAIKTALPFINLKKKANKKMPKTLP
jgi:hypothetical protein